MPADRRATIRSCLVALGLTACTSFGPDTMRYQQADYASALADAAKRQALLNIVKLRYGDVPAFVTVNQILAGYSLQGTVSVGTELLTGGSFRLSDDANVGVGSTFTNSPTITYAPVTGAAFARDLPGPAAARRPVRADAVQRAARAGAGHRPPFAGALQQRAGDGRGAAAAGPGVHRGPGPAARNCSGPDGLPVQLTVQTQNRVATVMIGKGETANSPERRLRRLLMLAEDRETFEIVYSLGRVGPGEIPIRTRSLLEILGQLAADIVVPESDRLDGRTEPGDPTVPSQSGQPHVHVRHGAFEPRDAFVAVAYDGDWFWIANNDVASKRLFSFVMLLLALSESSRPGQPPVITIPAG